ncbi:MAG: hypothetical protein J6A83_01660 [Clostridia bacterium]|nr:hypothetical protein [Clostridia bacterium]
MNFIKQNPNAQNSSKPQSTFDSNTSNSEKEMVLSQIHSAIECISNMNFDGIDEMLLAEEDFKKFTKVIIQLKDYSLSTNSVISYVVHKCLQFSIHINEIISRSTVSYDNKICISLSSATDIAVYVNNMTVMLNTLYNINDEIKNKTIKFACIKIISGLGGIGYTLKFYDPFKEEYRRFNFSYSMFEIVVPIYENNTSVTLIDRNGKEDTFYFEAQKYNTVGEDFALWLKDGEIKVIHLDKHRECARYILENNKNKSNIFENVIYRLLSVNRLMSENTLLDLAKYKFIAASAAYYITMHQYVLCGEQIDSYCEKVSEYVFSKKLSNAEYYNIVKHFVSNVKDYLDLYHASFFDRYFIPFSASKEQLYNSYPEDEFYRILLEDSSVDMFFYKKGILSRNVNKLYSHEYIAETKQLCSSIISEEVDLHSFDFSD